MQKSTNESIHCRVLLALTARIVPQSDRQTVSCERLLAGRRLWQWTTVFTVHRHRMNLDLNTTGPYSVKVWQPSINFMQYTTY